MDCILFEDEKRIDFLPFTYTRPVYELRAGLFTFRQRWEHQLGKGVYSLAWDYLGPAFTRLPRAAEAIWINGRVLPEAECLRLLEAARPHTAYLAADGQLLMARFAPALLPVRHDGLLSTALLQQLGLHIEHTSLQPLSLQQATDLFLLNGQLIAFDFELAVRTAKRAPLTDPYTRVYGADNLFIEEGASVRAAIIDAEDGPVFIGQGAQVLEGAIIKRPHAICPHAQLSMGAKLRGDSTIGPYCKAGGEITNSVLMGYSSKAHEGYLGNSILGFWCNLGADTNTSNLKNNYARVKRWSYREEKPVQTGLQFCGLTMGDHSKCGINTMFNTATVVGVFANIFGAGYPPGFIPSFSWGGSQGLSTYRFEKALEVAQRVMQRRKQKLSKQDQQILAAVFERTATFRPWEQHSLQSPPSRVENC
ncbi:MAG: glucose-1-phosphate thymidylyltransferase [Bacteroidetes bacterium]|nr:MAG: glucose-1-phosphate thymidylyltransferase [Bacteroidota bacterium]